MTDPSPYTDNDTRLRQLAQSCGLIEKHAIASPGNLSFGTASSDLLTLIQPAVLLLKCPVDQKVLLMEISPELYFETEAQIGQDLVLIRLDAISDEELTLRLMDARKTAELA